MTPEDTTVQVLIVWALALSTLINFGTVIWNIFSGPSKRNSIKLEDQAEILRKMDGRLSAVELAHRDMPKQKDFHDLEVKLTELNGVISVLTQRLKPLESVTERAQEWMMEHGGKS